MVENQNLLGGLYIWPGNILGAPRRSVKVLLGRGTSGSHCFACCHRDLSSNKPKKIDEIFRATSLIITFFNHLNIGLFLFDIPQLMQVFSEELASIESMSPSTEGQGSVKNSSIVLRHYFVFKATSRRL